VPFWRQTRDSSRDELGKGFGVNNLNAFTSKGRYRALSTDATADATDIDAGQEGTFTGSEVPLSNLIHTAELNGNAVNGAVAAGDVRITVAQQASLSALKPQERAYGANLNYVHKLDDLSEGLWFSICSGVVKDERKMDPEFGTFTTAKGKVYNTNNWDPAGAANLAATVVNPNMTLAKFLDGSGKNLDKTTAIVKYNQQAALTHGKIDTETHDKTRISDVEICLGWDFVQRDNARIGLSLGGVIPTGEESDAVFAFEPQAGSRHFQFGTGLHGSADLYTCPKGNGLTVVFDATYRYGFERTVKRLAASKSSAWGHYYLLAKTGAAVDTALIPAANVLAMDMEVKPGSMFDGTMMACLHSSDYSLDLGYNIYETQSL
jgi:hypothetical protein